MCRPHTTMTARVRPRPVALVIVKSVVSTLRAVRAAVVATLKTVPPGRFAALLAANCDSRRNCCARAVAHGTAASGLGHLGRAVVPTGLLRCAHRRHGVSLPPHGVHAVSGAVVRTAARCPDRGGGEHPQCRHRADAGPGRRLAGQPAGAPSPRRRGRRAAARPRLACRPRHADDPRGPVLRPELRSGRVCGPGAAVHPGDTGRGDAGHRGDRHFRRRADRSGQPAAAGGVALHRRSRACGAGLEIRMHRRQQTPVSAS